MIAGSGRRRKLVREKRNACETPDPRVVTSVAFRDCLRADEPIWLKSMTSSAIAETTSSPEPDDPAPIRWEGEPQRYSPVQDRWGLRDPQPGDFPPASKRVTQQPQPFHPETLSGREIMRVTYQGDDRCQLRCRGCYTGDRLNLPIAEVTAAGRRTRVSYDEFTAHLDGFAGLQDFYLLGAEATMDPAGSAAKLRYAQQQGLPQMAVTHGATSVEVFERTFGEALDSGGIYMLIISLDSMDAAVHNWLRGRDFAHQRTLRIIEHALRRGAPVKVQMTVWPQNYATILDAVAQLYERGVRGFAFHCGSLESDVATEPRHGLSHVDPLAWRALAAQLWSFRQAHRDQLWTFNIPWLFFTAAELASDVIGDAELTEAYLTHMDRLERGQETTKPVHACPALDLPQVYIYANDGATGQGAVSACNIHAHPTAGAVADYDPTSGQWQTVQDRDRNQLVAMATSPHLCPATPFALRTGSDRTDTELGPLFHACRYLASNQVAVDTELTGAEIYAAALEFYHAYTTALDHYPEPSEPGGEWPVQRIRRVTSGILGLAERARALHTDLTATESCC